MFIQTKVKKVMFPVPVESDGILVTLNVLDIKDKQINDNKRHQIESYYPVTLNKAFIIKVVETRLELYEEIKNNKGYWTVEDTLDTIELYKISYLQGSDIHHYFIKREG